MRPGEAAIERMLRSAAGASDLLMRESAAERPHAVDIGAGHGAAFAQAEVAMRDELELAAARHAAPRHERRQLISHACVRIGPFDVLPAAASSSA